MLDIQFTPYIPSTVIGLLGLICGYLFYYFKNKSESRLSEIQSVPEAERGQALAMGFNDLGVTIDTTGMSEDRKMELLKGLMYRKFQRLLIASVTLIVICGLATFLIYSSTHNESNHDLHSKSDTITRVNHLDTLDPLNTTDTLVCTEILKTEPQFGARAELKDTVAIVEAAVKYQFNDGVTYCEMNTSCKARRFYHIEITLYDRKRNNLKLFIGEIDTLSSKESPSFAGTSGMTNTRFIVRYGPIDSAVRARVLKIDAKLFWN